MDEMLMLVSSQFTTDDIGNEIPVLSEREIFCDCLSISQSEYFGCAQNGLKPEYVFRIWSDEYGGEELVKYKNVLYSVYRTYKSKDYTELYVTQKARVSNG